MGSKQLFKPGFIVNTSEIQFVLVSFQLKDIFYQSECKFIISSFILSCIP